MRPALRLTSRDLFIDALRSAGDEKRPLSCAELARRADCSKAMIGHLRTGKAERVSPRLAARIERGLGVGDGSLFVP